ncbi:MAG: hypothetical protein MJE63_16545 [Proteobacteria bacterium]|nr:hypothetical protein [Pseudomonadota bacterium]
MIKDFECHKESFEEIIFPGNRLLKKGLTFDCSHYNRIVFQIPLLILGKVSFGSQANRFTPGEMGQSIIYDNIAISFETDSLANELKITKRPQLVKSLNDMTSQLVTLARPKALAVPVAPIINNGASLSIEGFEFQSNVLKINLEQANNIFAVLVTAGKEADTWIRSFDDILFQYWADHLVDNILRQSISYLEEEIRTKYNLSTLSWMTPGSLEEWPISEQEKLFGIFGENALRLDVSLTDNFIMQPLKSLSGVMFDSTDPFFSCQLCDKSKCEKRRAEYDLRLARQKYGLKS